MADEQILPDDESRTDYEAWFRAEITQALAEADDPGTIWIDHDEVVRQSRDRHAAFLAWPSAQKCLSK